MITVHVGLIDIDSHNFPICGAAYEGILVHAAKMAKECEEQHKKDGNAEGVSIRTYFLSGGLVGKPKIVKGGVEYD